MIKRIAVICLAALLCVPCLGVAVCAATIDSFSFDLTWSDDFGGFMFSVSEFYDGKYTVDFEFTDGSNIASVHLVGVELIGVWDDFSSDYVYSFETTSSLYVNSAFVESFPVALLLVPGEGFGVFVINAFGADDLANMDSAILTITRIPDVGESAITVLLDCISSFLLGALSWFGVVIGAVLAPGGVLSALWPLVGLGVCLALVYAGVGLIRRFSP